MNRGNLLSGLSAFFLSWVLLMLAACAAGETAGILETTLQGTVFLEEDLIVRDGKRLVIAAGTTVTAAPKVMILAMDGGSLIIEGTAEAPIILRAADGISYWGGILVETAGATLSLKHAEISGAPVQVNAGADGIIEDCYLHDYLTDIPPIILGEESGSLVVRRTHVRRFFELHFVKTAALVEDCLLENMVGDGIDFDTSPEGATVRRTTIRNTMTYNVDAIDFGVVLYPFSPGSRGLVEDCEIYDVTDKGISVGEQAALVTVRNTLIHHLGIGIGVKDSSNVTLSGCTITDSNFGINCWEERGGLGGGNLTVYDSIVWNNLIPVRLLNGSRASIGYSWVQGPAPYPGTGNGNTDPGFQDIPGRDYRLRPDSPLLTASTENGPLGPSFPLGSSLTAAQAETYMPTPVTVAIYGDSHPDSDGSTAVHDGIVSKLVTASPDMVFHTGDMVLDGSNQTLWNAFHAVIAPLYHIAPLYPAPGDQDTDGALFLENNELSASLPYYEIHKEHVQFLVLDTSGFLDAASPQYQWLDGQLRTPPPGVVYRIVVMHYPMFSVGSPSHPDPAMDLPQATIDGLILLLDTLGVDMVFAGHNHFYERRNATSLSSVRYVTTGGGGAPLQEAASTPGPDTVFRSAYHYCILTVSEHTLDFQAIGTDGLVLDALRIEK